MKNKYIILSKNQQEALDLLKKSVVDVYSITNIVIFGSTARGEAEDGSDLDVLLVTTNQLSHRERHAVYAMTTKINWQFDTNISVTIVDEQNWECGFYSVLPIKEEVQRDGVPL